MLYVYVPTDTVLYINYRRCQGDFTCDYLATGYGQQVSQTCSDVCFPDGCTDFESALLCSAVRTMQGRNYFYDCDKALPEPLDQPLDDKACGGLCEQCENHK